MSEGCGNLLRINSSFSRSYPLVVVVLPFLSSLLRVVHAFYDFHFPIPSHVFPIVLLPVSSSQFRSKTTTTIILLLENSPWVNQPLMY